MFRIQVKTGKVAAIDMSGVRLLRSTPPAAPLVIQLALPPESNEIFMVCFWILMKNKESLPNMDMQMPGPRPACL